LTEGTGRAVGMGDGNGNWGRHSREKNQTRTAGCLERKKKVEREKKKERRGVWGDPLTNQKIYVQNWQKSGALPVGGTRGPIEGGGNDP